MTYNIKYWLKALVLTFTVLIILPLNVKAAEVEDTTQKETLDVKEIIFEHLGDGYGWEVPFSHVYRIPLPVIVRAKDGKWFCFSSADLTKVEIIRNPLTGKIKEHLVPVVKSINKDGKSYKFLLSKSEDNKDKVVQLIEDPDGTIKEYRPLDLSITKNVAALIIAAILLTIVVMSLVRFYAKNGFKAPSKGLGFFEMLVSFVYYDTIKATLGDNAKKFGPYLLTAFFFILTMNLVGLIVIFPGGANLTGNIAITLVLAVCTFVATNLFGTKHYWKEIFWPEVPLFLKFPLPIMQFIEIFGIFTKPAALCVRLFANMMGGHIIVITLTLLIFIFAAFGSVATSGATVVSVLFSVFMLALDVLVSFIQAYVFTLLSALFIGMAVVKEDEHHGKKIDSHDEMEDLAGVAKSIDMKN